MSLAHSKPPVRLFFDQMLVLFFNIIELKELNAGSTANTGFMNDNDDDDDEKQSTIFCN